MVLICFGPQDTHTPRLNRKTFENRNSKKPLKVIAEPIGRDSKDGPRKTMIRPRIISSSITGKETLVTVSEPSASFLRIQIDISILA